MRRSSFLLLAVAAAPMLAQAEAIDLCRPQSARQGVPVRETILAPVAIELTPATTRLGAPGGVLAQTFDEALAVDNVLLRMKLEGCQSIANASPTLGAVKPDDPAAYKPKTEFDNTPWRFNMTQDGKRMTADEFDAWMKSKGVRVATGAPVAAPPAAATAAPDKPSK